MFENIFEVNSKLPLSKTKEKANPDKGVITVNSKDNGVGLYISVKMQGTFSKASCLMSIASMANDVAKEAEIPLETVIEAIIQKSRE